MGRRTYNSHDAEGYTNEMETGLGYMGMAAGKSGYSNFAATGPRDVRTADGEAGDSGKGQKTSPIHAMDQGSESV